MVGNDSGASGNQSLALSPGRRRFLRGAAGVCLASTVGIGSVGATKSSPGDERWRVDFGNSDSLSGPSLSPVVDGSLFVNNTDAVHALTASTGDEEWQFGVGETRLLDSPIVSDGTVFVATDVPFGSETQDESDTSVYALDAATGTQEWQFDAYEQSVAPLVVADDTVFIPGQFCVYAVDAATGDQRWQFEVGYGVEDGLTVSDGTLYVGDSDGNVFAVNVATGEEAWRFDVGMRLTTELTVADGTLFVGAMSDAEQQPAGADLQYYISALDGATGDERWRFTLDTATGEDDPGIVSPRLEFVTVVDDTVFAGSDECYGNSSACSSLYAVDATTGEETWQFEASGSVDTMTKANGTVFAGTALGRAGDGIVHAVDADTGTEVWNFNAGNLLASPVTVVNGTLFVVSRIIRSTEPEFEDAYRLNALDAATGDEKWQFVAERDIDPPRFADDTVFLSADYTTVHALDAGTADPNEETETDDTERSADGDESAASRSNADEDSAGETANDESNESRSESEGNESATAPVAADDTESDDGSENPEDEMPGMGIPAAVTSLGGVGYLLKRRLERFDSDDS
ncbi:PQQ-binding-like beta-propeller repeat protein [Natrinema soli]|uniref:PQQ-binding-like beta-propeller repeat protein n=1 Tax=Natrinema soli TaxID=1930624 RepID=A0ABD5SYP9_9EURY|nr:PQQ-binding-like beta-propeller repeat protein [Natrinema soli]